MVNLDRRKVPLRVFAMARPARSAQERELVARAAAEIGASGSARARARAVAEGVAPLALAHVRNLGGDPSPLLLLADAAMRTPTLAALAEEPGLDAPAIAREAALREFARGGCRWSEPTGRGRGDAAVQKAVAKRLAERFRRGAK